MSNIIIGFYPLENSYCLSENMVIIHPFFQYLLITYHMPTDSLKRPALGTNTATMWCDTAERYTGTVKVHKRKWLILEGITETELHHSGNEADKVRAFYGERMKISKVWSSDNMANLREFSSILLRLGGELRDMPSWEKTRRHLLSFLLHPG